MNPNKTKVIILTGPTASGKTGFAVQLAKEVNGEIISADSRQVFKDMDIGTGKDLDEYQDVRYHLIDIREAGADFSVSEFQHEAMKALETVAKHDSIPIVCGGTGHYVKALLSDYNFSAAGTDLDYTKSLESLSREELYMRIKELDMWNHHHWEQDSKRRMARAIEKKLNQTPALIDQKAFQSQFIHRIYYLNIDRLQLRKNIKIRLQQRFEEGMIAEVENLLKKGITHSRLMRYGLEYKWISRYLQKEISFEELFDKLNIEIGRFAKRQMTFIRYMIKSGHTMIPIDSYAEFHSKAVKWLTEY